MSKITNLILMCSLSDYDHGDESTHGNLTAINSWLSEKGFAPLEYAEHHAVGTKKFCLSVFLAAYNYFPEDAFAEMFSGLQWEIPENVILVMEPEEYETKVLRPN